MSLIRNNSFSLTLKQHLQEHKNFFLTTFSKLTLEELVKISQINEFFAELAGPVITERSKVGNNLPSDLVKIPIANLLSMKDHAHMTQVNHFFKTNLEQNLQKKKIAYIKSLEKTVDDLMDDFQNVMGDTTFPGWTLKLFAVQKLLANLNMLKEGSERKRLGLEFFVYFALSPFMEKKFEYHNRKECCTIYMENMVHRLKISSPPLDSIVEAEYQHYFAAYQKYYPHMNPGLQNEISRGSLRRTLSIDLAPFLKAIILREKGLVEVPEEKVHFSLSLSF